MSYFYLFYQVQQSLPGCCIKCYSYCYC